MKALHKAALIGVTLALYSTAASAQLTNQGMLDQVVTEFATRATAWQTVVMNAATFLFWTLGTISLVWTFGFMALRKADIGEFFAEFIRFILFFGFFLWLLRNGPAFANSIIQSLARIGEQASGVVSVTPSGIVDIGFMILRQAFTNSSIWSPVDSFIGVALSVGILILLAVVAVNMLLLLVSGWLLMYAGIFFLGFGGSRWTSDMAINYYKTVLGVAVQIMTMVLLVGIGNDLLSGFYARMNTGTLNFEELGVMLVFCVALLMLVNRVPPLIAGIITGTGIGNAGGIGNFGAGAAVGAAMGAASVAAGAASMAGAAVMSGAANLAGGASAVKAAFEKAQGSATGDAGAGTDMMASVGGAGASGGQESAGAGGSPFAQAAGFGGSSSGGQQPLGQLEGWRQGQRRRQRQQLDGQHRQRCRQGRQERTQARWRGRTGAAGRTRQHRPRWFDSCRSIGSGHGRRAGEGRRCSTQRQGRAARGGLPGAHGPNDRRPSGNGDPGQHSSRGSGLRRRQLGRRTDRQSGGRSR
ncbi:P-type conjugative transfer protein TrbL [Burkholderia cenocepacia]|uniref:P-type conjugative transfer protein TrbL n=1 Tax=Burkholderia cenocepacia TaxID=95486 RepID=UPI00209B063C|nr:P-type conjugative transfer protein TrbL [Burkholderia cenocepacia]